MAEIEPPSFSLGFDFDSDFEPSQHHQPLNLPTQKKTGENEKEVDDEFELRVSDSEPDSPPNSSLTRLRRLRRGGPSYSKPISTPISNFLDDDIEDFSDEESVPTNDLLATQHPSSCSSSKLPLSGCGALRRQPKSLMHNIKEKENSSCPSTILGSNKGKNIFSGFTSSPLRRFQLLDSDTDLDEPSDGVHIGGKTSVDDFSKNNKQKESGLGSHKIALGNNEDPLPPFTQKQDLWKDFCLNENSSVQTPAFDECCEEYFKSVKPSKQAAGSHKFSSSDNVISINNAKKMQQQDSGSVPPSHSYFFHDDLRIQNLVRCRLPHFFPLSVSGDAGYKSHNVSSINYMSQFGQDGAKQQTGRQVSLEKSSQRERKKTKNFGVEDTSLGSGDWVNTKQTASTPKDAGRRRVHASGQSAGQWFTKENGMKVYVTRDGKELTGKLAFIHYRKESGRGFKKFKRKRAGKKK